MAVDPTCVVPHLYGPEAFRDFQLYQTTYPLKLGTNAFAPIPMKYWLLEPSSRLFHSCPSNMRFH